MKDKLLVIAPHSDDETLGCGGLIARTIEEGGEVTVLVFSHNYGMASYEEFYKTMALLNVSYKTVGSFDALKFDQIEILSIVSKIEEVCKDIKPTTVAIPFAGFHQDHEAVNKAALIALRPHGYMPQRVLVYEQPYYGTWGNVFKPNYYVDITNQLDKKIEALECYKSQKIPFDMVKAMALLRGGESGVKYAESYMLMREIV